MKSFITVRAFAIFLTLLLVVTSILFIAPQKTYAIPGVGVPVVEQGPALAKSFITAAKTTIIAALEDIGVTQETIIAVKTTASLISDIANEASLKLLVVDRYVIQPLAFILSGNLLKAMTSGIVAFVIGQTNGTGIPQFVQNVNGLMQSVGDLQASVFFRGFSQLNSPFGSSITSALRINYLQQTSAAGFFAANKSTLFLASPNINAFLNGNWSQGGVRAWFALTTQSQNNPYMLYLNSQNQLASLAATAQSATIKQLDFGKGFLSWCGSNISKSKAATDIPIDTNADPDAIPTAYNASAGASGLAVATPNCFQSDGSPGIIKTPGTLIVDAYNKITGSEVDKLSFAGNAGKEINAMLGNVAGALNSVNTMMRLVGGMGNSLGLAGAAISSGGARSVLGGLDTPFLGASASNVINSGAAINGGGLASRISQYQNAINGATAAIAQAQASVGAPAACSSNASSTPLAADSSSEFATQIQVALAEVAQGQTTLDNAKFVLAEANANPDSSGDLASLDGVQPTGEDIATMQQIPGQMAAVSAGVRDATCTVQAP